MIINSITEIKSIPIFYLLADFISHSKVYLKLEGLNIAGSIKLKTANWLVSKLEQENKIIANHSVLVCSSSGNLAIALSIVCKEKNYPLVCVSDLNLSPTSEKYIRTYGAQLIKVDIPDQNGGYLKTRLKFIEQLLKKNAHYVFIDQYANEENINAHYFTTAFEIISEFSKLDYLFIGAGTTGTLMGCAKLFKQVSPQTKIIGVDAVGSVTFGHPPAKRYIPGLGTSFKPPIADLKWIDDLLLVKEEDTITMCRACLHNRGLLLGGSSGSVLHGVKIYSERIKPNSTIVAISPDFGDRYINTIYNDEWVKEKFLLDLPLF